VSASGGSESVRLPHSVKPVQRVNTAAFKHEPTKPAPSVIVGAEPQDKSKQLNKLAAPDAKSPGLSVCWPSSQSVEVIIIVRVTITLIVIEI